MSDDFMQSAGGSEPITVPFSDDETVRDEELITDDDSPNASPEERQSRKQKRSERIKRMLDEGKQSKEQVAALKAEQDQLKQELAQLRGFVSAQQQARPEPKGDGKDEWERQLDAVYEKQAQAYQAAQAEVKAGTFTEERAKHYERIARDVENEKTRIHTERVIAQREPLRRQEQAQQIWVQKYPEVYSNQRAFQYASATFEQRKALGETPTNELVDEVMQDAMTRFRLGPKKAPTQSERARLSGVASSGGGGGGGKDSSGIVLTPELKRMAVARFPELKESDAIKKWVDGPGKRLRAKKVL